MARVPVVSPFHRADAAALDPCAPPSPPYESLVATAADWTSLDVEQNVVDFDAVSKIAASLSDVVRRVVVVDADQTVNVVGFDGVAKIAAGQVVYRLVVDAEWTPADAERNVDFDCVANFGIAAVPTATTTADATAVEANLRQLVSAIAVEAPLPAAGVSADPNEVAVVPVVVAVPVAFAVPVAVDSDHAKMVAATAVVDVVVSVHATATDAIAAAPIAAAAAHWATAEVAAEP